MVLLFVYRDTLLSMVEIWNRSDTFAHGWVVAPISLWLVWRNRSRLAVIEPRFSLLGLVLCLMAGFGWMLGRVASVAVVQQFALVGMLIGLVWAISGTGWARAMAFPLAFLAFAVPFGEFLFPRMMDWTTNFIVGALRLSQVPVYAEGRNLVLPSGNWSVVEGCSGIRYLIASFMVGSLYAYLTYRSFRRRLIFTLFALVMPVVANWLRAYAIVMIGHFSNNKLATGVDHLVYGWVFFGIVIMLMFWIGGFWREDSPLASEDPKGMLAPVAEHRWQLLAAVALAAVLLWSPLLALLEGSETTGEIQLAPISAGGPWKEMDLQSVSGWLPSYSGMRVLKQTAWRAENGKPVGSYLAYYRNQRPGHELVSWDNRILINKDPDWSQASYGSRTIEIGKEKVDVRFTELFNSSGRRLVWNWYWINGRWTSSDHLAKAYLMLSRLTGQPDDSAAVILHAPFEAGGRQEAEQRLEAFARQMGPALGDAFARTAER